MLNNLVAEAFSLGGALAFAAGLLTAFLYIHGKCWFMKRKGTMLRSHKPRFSPVWLGIGLSLIAFMWITVKSNNAQTLAEQTAIEVAACQKEFNETLAKRSAITTENDRISLAQRDAIVGWVHDLVFPPPNIAGLPQDAPERQQYALQRTIQLDGFFRATQEEQRKNEQERAANPLPEPTCGREE